MPFGYHPKGEAAEAETSVDCPNCGAPVLHERAHMAEADWVSPGYWTCDPLVEMVRRWISGEKEEDDDA